MTTDTAYRFGRFALLPQQRQLLVDGHAAKLGARAFELLLALIERRERIVTRNELLDLVWAGRVVEDQNLQVQMVALRKLLGAQAIVTVPGRGYRFALPLADAAQPSMHDAETTHAATAAAHSAPADAAIAPALLPAALPTLYGRVADIADVARLLGQHRLVSIVGPGGVGKTRLAQAVASQLRPRFADGVCVVELASLNEGALIAPTAARALGFAPGERLAGADGLAATLSGLQLLLVLDNCEHLLQPAAALAARLLAAAPRLALLVTSQQPLRVAGEQCVRLAPLGLPAPGAAPDEAAAAPALALFAARARAADARFMLGAANIDAAVEICRRLDGLPLAIELAAARVRLLGVDGVRARLHERLRLLTAGERNAPPRQQTLRDALRWSAELLDDAERAVFRRLGVFNGSFTLEAAQAVAGDTSIDAWSVLDHLGALVDRSLVQVDSGAPPRYRLLESARAFAREALDAAGERAALRERHARTMLERLEDAAERLLVEPVLPWLQRLWPELDDWRDAFAWACARPDATFAARLGVAGAAALLAVGHGAQARDALIAARPTLDTDPALGRWRARALMAAGELGRTVAVSAAEAAAAARDAAEAFDALGERTHRYCALYMQARCAEHIGDLEATRQAEAALWAMEDGTLPAAVLHRGRLRRAREHLREGRLAAAVDLSMPEVARLRAAGDLYAAWQANFPLMMSLVLLDRTAEALASTHAVIGEVRALGMQRHCWNELALHLIAAVEHGDVEEARATLRELLPTLLAIDALPWPGHQLAWLPLFAGEAAAAARVHGWLFARSAERGLRSSPLDARGRDRLAERLQQHFSAGALDALKAEGAALTAPQVAELLLRD